jgi:hypothetical protein
MSQIESSSTSIGIRNLECAVRPFGSSKDATSDEATVSTIFLFALKYAIIVFHRNVFLVPPCLMTKKIFGSLLRTEFLSNEMQFFGHYLVAGKVYLILFLTYCNHAL